MGVHITGIEGKSALFDSTSGLAFGPVFEDDTEAEDFLEWLVKQETLERTFVMGFDILYFGSDPRKFRIHEVEEMVRIFREEFKSRVFVPTAEQE